MEKYNGLDIARTYSIVGIILMHVLGNTNYHFRGFVFEQLIPSFTNLVFLLMMLSAFGMCCGYYEKFVNKTIDINKFFSRRYKKMWPFFAVVCSLDLVINPSLNSLYEYFANLTLVQGLLPNPSISVIGVSWTLAVIFVFYLLFPFFVFLLSNRNRAWLAFIVSIIMNFMCQVYFFDKNHILQSTNLRENILFSGMFFMNGGMIYLYRDKIIFLVRKYKPIFIIITFSSLCAYYFM